MRVRPVPSYMIPERVPRPSGARGHREKAASRPLGGPAAACSQAAASRTTRNLSVVSEPPSAWSLVVATGTLRQVQIPGPTQITPLFVTNSFIAKPEACDSVT